MWAWDFIYIFGIQFEEQTGEQPQPDQPKDR